MFLVGLTGGIGSGKSMVSRMLMDLGRTVLQADSIAAEIINSDPSVRDALAKKFGPDVYDADGHLNTRFVAGIVFNRPSSLRALNRIVHPKAIARIQALLASLPSRLTRPYVVVEAALIYEARIDAMFDLVVVIDAPEKVRLLRTMKRSGESKKGVLARMRSQLAPEEKARKAPIVIRNSGTAEELLEKVLFLDTFLQLYAKSAVRGRGKLKTKGVRKGI